MDARSRGKKRSITGEEEKTFNSLGWSSNGGVRDSPRNKAPPGKKVKGGRKLTGKRLNSAVYLKLDCSKTLFLVLMHLMDLQG